MFFRSPLSQSYYVLCFLWSASMFPGCLPQCPIYVVTCKVLRGWPLLPCVYNNRITINVLYFSPEQVVSRCLLKLQRPLSKHVVSRSAILLVYHYLHRTACPADVNFALLTGNLLTSGSCFKDAVPWMASDFLLFITSVK